MSTTFEQGWAARPFKEQFPQLSDASAERLDAINEAITTVYVGGIATHGWVDQIRKTKFPKIVAEALAEAGKA